MTYKYRIGDRVRHKYYRDVKGIVTKIQEDYEIITIRYQVGESYHLLSDFNHTFTLLKYKNL